MKYAMQRNTGAVFRFSNNTTLDETVSLSQSGRVTGYTDAYNGNTAGANYAYDKAGRLTAATVDNNSYAYGYNPPSGSTCNQSSANPNSHKNSNRTSFTANGVTTTYCYNHADQLIATSDTQIGTPTYDDHGNTLTLAGNGTPITFTYDASDTNTAIQQGDYKVEYVKSASGSVLRKKEYQQDQGQQTYTLTTSYRYLSGGAVMQSCNLTDDNDCTTTDTYLSLPGGTTLTLSPTNPDTTKRTTYSLKNYHGDTTITVGVDGTPQSSIYLYEPFGMAAPSQAFGTSSDPSNASDFGMAWAANPTRKLAGTFTIPIIQMGARVYLPTAGRFLQVDPVEGGTPNSYVYPGDPVNGHDYSGLCAYIIQCTATVYRIQPAAQISQVQPTASATSVQRTSTKKLQAKAKTTKTLTQRTGTRVQGSRIKPIVSDMSKIPNTTSVRGGLPLEGSKVWNWWGAGGSAMSWTKGGIIVGGIGGCVLGGAGGAFVGVLGGPLGVGGGATVGCMGGGKVGSWAGGVTGGLIGWGLGGTDHPSADFFDGLDQVIGPQW